MMLQNEDYKLNRCNVSQLTAICRRLSLHTSGRKSALIARITSDLKSKGVSVDSILYPDKTGFEKAPASIRIEEKSGPALNNEFLKAKQLLKPQCLCGMTSLKKNKDDAIEKFVLCDFCSNLYHINCYNWKGKDNFVCIWCRSEILDPFYELEKYFHCIELKNEWYHLDLECKNISQWHMKEIIISCHRVDTEGIYNEWPYTFSLSVNNNKEFNVPAPSWEHKRRDAPFKITPLLRPFTNQLVIKQSNCISELGTFIICIGLYKPLSIPLITNTILENNIVFFDSAKTRIMNIVNHNSEDDEVQCMEISRRIKLDCPITFSRIKIPSRGHYCKHLQCFDLTGFLEVTYKMRAFNMRWKCPECSLSIRPKDLVVDDYVANILKSTEEDISVVEIQQNGDYEIVDKHDLINESFRADRERMLATYNASYLTSDIQNCSTITEKQVEVLDLEDDEETSENVISQLDKNSSIQEGQEIVYKTNNQSTSKDNSTTFSDLLSEDNVNNNKSFQKRKPSINDVNLPYIPIICSAPSDTLNDVILLSDSDSSDTDQKIESFQNENFSFKKSKLQNQHSEKQLTDSLINFHSQFSTNSSYNNNYHQQIYFPHQFSYSYNPEFLLNLGTPILNTIVMDTSNFHSSESQGSTSERSFYPYHSTTD